MKFGNKWYKGQELWENIQTWSCIALLIVALILTNLKVQDDEGNLVSLINTQTLGYIIQGLVFYVLAYAIGYVFALYSHARKKSGTPIIKGPNDQGPGKGEDCEFRVKKFKRADQNTQVDKDELRALLEQAKREGRLQDLTNEGKLKVIKGVNNGKTTNKENEEIKNKDNKSE